jgi:hypothetical protein
VVVFGVIGFAVTEGGTFASAGAALIGIAAVATEGGSAGRSITSAGR